MPPKKRSTRLEAATEGGSEDMSAEDIVSNNVDNVTMPVNTGLSRKRTRSAVGQNSASVATTTETPLRRSSRIQKLAENAFLAQYPPIAVDGDDVTPPNHSLPLSLFSLLFSLLFSFSFFLSKLLIQFFFF